jgi:hypothetical protein
VAGRPRRWHHQGRLHLSRPTQLKGQPLVDRDRYLPSPSPHCLSGGSSRHLWLAIVTHGHGSAKARVAISPLPYYLPTTSCIWPQGAERLVLCLLGLEASVLLVAGGTLVLSWLSDRRADSSETLETRYVRTSRTVLVWPGRWAAQVGRGHLGPVRIAPADGRRRGALVAGGMARPSLAARARTRRRPPRPGRGPGPRAWLGSG